MKLDRRKKITLLRLGLSALLTAAAFILTKTILSDMPLYITIAAYIPAFLIVGFKTLRKAFLGIIKGQVFDENFLMTLASVCAMCLGECFEAVAILFFSGVGDLFEETAVDRVRQSVASLASLCPDSATVIRDGEEINLPSAKIEVGDITLIRAGERIVTDGVIIEGSAALDCSAMTGESNPVDVFEGSEVTSGCINLDGTLKIKTTRKAENSGAARIISMIEDSAMKKTSAEKFMTRFSLKYTPCVVIAAVLIAVLLPVFSITDVRSSVYSALCFLVISCPCALVISVPLAFFGAIGGSAKKGVLFKSNKALEAMSKLKTVLFDKTGTLTKGAFGIGEVYPFGETDKDGLLTYAYAAEESSSHPISRALCGYAENNGIKVAADEIGDIHELRGMGRVCTYKGSTVLAGNIKLLEKYGVALPEEVKNIETKGMSTVYVAIDTKYIGLITLWDTPKAESEKAVSALKAKGIKAVMLTGDGKESAENMAKVLGITEYKYGLLPEDKVKLTEGYISGKGKNEGVAFVGDGINDAPSLARADVGIAMGQLGSDAAIEAADVVIVNDSPMKVVEAYETSKSAMRIARQNIVFSIGVKFAVLILSAFSITGMIAAIFADVGVSVIAILNAMRTLRK